MTPRLARPLLALLCAAAVPVMPAQQPPPAPTTGPSGAPPPLPVDDPNSLVSLKLPDGDIDAVLSLLEMYTGKIILRPAALPTATYNLKIEKKVPKSEAVVYIQTILALNRIGVTPLGNNALKVVDLAMSRTEAPEMITGSAFDQPASGKIATKIFQLDFIRVQEFAGMVQTMLNPNLQGGLVQLAAANAAIITDSVSNLQRVELLLRDLDRPNAGVKPKFYTLKSAKASDMMNKIRGIITGPLQTQFGQSTTFSADDRTNQLIVIADPRLIGFFDDMIEKLDGKSDPNTRSEVMYLKHADATEVATLVGQVVQGQNANAQKANAASVRPGQFPTTPTPAVTAPGQPIPTPAPAAPVTMNNLSADLIGSANAEFSTLITVFPDKRSNAIVVSGTVGDIALVTNLVNKLDTILAQVRLEVVICEVSLSDNATSGIGELGLVVAGDKLTGFSGAFPGLSIADGTVTRPGGTASVSGPWDLAGTIKIATSPRKSTTNILSVPTITTTHNKKAVFFFGETRPIVNGITSTPTTGGTSGFSTSSQVQQTEIGTTINVKPLIGIDGSVQLDIEMEISEVGDTVRIDNNDQYVISKRKANSYTTAKSGEILVLGGMQRKKAGKSTNRLGPIPILGDLLGTRKREDQRTDLLFFIRPLVLTNVAAEDNRETMQRVEKFDSKQREDLKQKLDPTYVPPPRSLIDKVLDK